MKKASVFEQEIVRAVDLPARAYTGYAMAMMHKGREVILMAESVEKVIEIATDIRPSTAGQIDPKQIYPVALIHDRHIKRLANPQPNDDEEL